CFQLHAVDFCLLLVMVCCVFFFCQAEDGIRDRNVTGVQTCALPIWFVFVLRNRFWQWPSSLGSPALKSRCATPSRRLPFPASLRHIPRRNGQRNRSLQCAFRR